MKAGDGHIFPPCYSIYLENTAVHQEWQASVHLGMSACPQVSLLTLFLQT